ncbi:hypothetical protein HK098_005862 [Nowakowskiella sp. JEL0407]|nr:hypothetical protein HK098_005862 [Nowakowskiella sp. JEL0407]
MAPFEATRSVISALLALMTEIRDGVQILTPQQTSIFLIILENPLVMQPEYVCLLMPLLCSNIIKLDDSMRIYLVHLICDSLKKLSDSREELLSASYLFQQMIGIFQQFITIQLLSSEYSQINDDPVLVVAIQAFEVICEAI